MKNYGQMYSLKATNWLFLTSPNDANEVTTRALAEAYNVYFESAENDQKAYGVVTHVIDKGGRFAAKCHGLKFGPVNLILYVSGLIDSEAISDGHAENHHEKGIWDRMKSFFSLNDSNN